MPTWRCPHCQTPQPESSRCWVCKQSSTSCSTCLHFRRAIAGHLGYCGLDRRRLPLRGDEIRGCWEGASVPVPLTEPVLATERTAPDGEPPRGVNRLEFVPVVATTFEAAVESAVPAPVTTPTRAAESGRASLWDD